MERARECRITAEWEPNYLTTLSLNIYIYMTINHLKNIKFECAGCSTEEIFCSTIPCHFNMFLGNITGHRSQLSCST